MKQGTDGIRVYHRCGGCGKKQELFLSNDEDTALLFGNNIAFLKQNNAGFN